MMEEKNNSKKILTSLYELKLYQLVILIGIIMVFVSAFPVFEQMTHNFIYFFGKNTEQTIFYCLFTILILSYLMVYLYINRFLTQIYIPSILSFGLVLLFGLTKNSMGSWYQPISFETFIYLVVFGFILLFTFVFTVEKVGNERFILAILFGAAAFAIVVIGFILVFLIGEALPLIEQYGFFEFLFGIKWESENPPIQYGAIPLVWGTLITAFGGILISVPISLAVAIYLAEIAPEKVKIIIKPAIELLAGIPSIVIGFFGLVILVPFLQEPIPGYYFLASGSSSFAGMLILAVMSLPTITSVAEDAISAVPQNYKDGSLALGSTNWQTISRVTVPAAVSGITAAIILGMGRAIGETMAVMMVMGNTPIITPNIFEGMQAITGALAVEMAEAGWNTTHYHALFGLAVILLVMTLIINFLSIVVIERLKVSFRKKEKKETRISLFFEQYGSILLIGTMVLAALIVWLFLAASITPIGAIVAYILIFLVYQLKRRFYDNLPAKTKQAIAYFIIFLAVLIMLGTLVWLLSHIILNGIPGITLEFLTQNPVGTEGGIFPVIVGTTLLVIGTIVFALPIGVCAAIYLVEYQREGRYTKIIRSGFDLLNGTPSIVYGFFGYAFFSLSLGWGKALIAGQLTLGLMILPTVLRTTEEALKSVPHSVREGSLALGATKWQTIRKVVLPPAFPGILTGAILSIGRAAGETAPILFCAATFFNPGREIPSSLFDPVYALPYYLFQLTEYPASATHRFATAFVLFLLVVAFYAMAIVIRNYYQKKIQW